MHIATLVLSGLQPLGFYVCMYVHIGKQLCSLLLSLVLTYIMLLYVKGFSSNIYYMYVPWPVANSLNSPSQKTNVHVYLHVGLSILCF